MCCVPQTLAQLMCRRCWSQAGPLTALCAPTTRKASSKLAAPARAVRALLALLPWLPQRLISACVLCCCVTADFYKVKTRTAAHLTEAQQDRLPQAAKDAVSFRCDTCLPSKRAPFARTLRSSLHACLLLAADSKCKDNLIQNTQNSWVYTSDEVDATAKSYACPP